MARRARDKPEKGKSETTNSKKKFSQTEANAPMTDSVDWRKRILEGTVEGRIAAIKEAVEKKETDAADVLIKAFGDEDNFVAFAVTNAIVELTVTEEQYQRIISLFREGSDLERMDAVEVLGPLKDSRAVPYLIAEMNDEDSCVCVGAAEALWRIGDKRAVPEFIKFLKLLDGNDIIIDGVIHEAVCGLGELGDKKAIAPLKKLLVRCVQGGIEWITIETSLKKLGVLSSEIDNLVAQNAICRRSKNPLEEFLDSPEQISIYRMVSKNKNVKRLVFENAEILEILPDQQAWITINDPQLAKDSLELALEKLGKKRSSLENVLRSSLGVRIKQLEDAHFTYYADEILDVISQVVRNSRLKNDKELSALLSQIRYGNGGVQLRYIQRELSDLSLGDKCGDCTAKGSVNFASSVTWLVNPAYQILKMSKGKRFIGKINFTLGNISGQDAIIVDALEFNPQAQKGKPYHEDGLECLDVALSFLRGLAKKEKRKLFALRVSNSGGAVDVLEENGRQIITNETWEGYMRSDPKHSETLAQLSLMVPTEDVSRTLATVGHEGEVKLFYQMLDNVGGEENYAPSIVDSRTVESKDLADEKLPVLEREVINPAQITNPEIAAAMSERDFEKASSLILADGENVGKISKIFRLPEGLKPSPKFLSTRLEKIYKAVAMDSESLKRTFIIRADNFVRL